MYQDRTRRPLLWLIAIAMLGALVGACGAPVQVARAATPTAWRYTAATSSVTDSSGNTWSPLGADVVGGWSATASPRQIYGTTDDALYLPERVGLTAIHVPLPSGTYDISFLVAETDGATAGQRVFDVAFEGRAAWNGLDIAKTVGPNVRLNVRATRTVTDGTLDIAVTRRVGYGKVNALQITRVDQPPVKVMPLGDSITYGMDPSSQCPSLQPGYTAPQGSYRVELGTRLGAGFVYVGSGQNGPLTLVGGRRDEGHCGIWLAREPHDYDYSILHSIDGWLASAQPDVIVLDGGTNDLHQGTSPADTASHLTDLLNRIYADEPHVRVLVTTLCPAGSADTSGYNALLPGVVAAQQQGGHLVGLVDLARLANLQYPADYQDAIHPNVSGYRKMGDALYPAVASAINAVRADQ